MKSIGIVANGPETLIPELVNYQGEIDCWIGADRGALTLIQSGIRPNYALGDFDSINKQEEMIIEKNSKYFKKYPVEKDQTDIEIAIEKALEIKADTIYLFGVTGGRLDHGLVNIQMLYRLLIKKCTGIIIDCTNQMQIYEPGSYLVKEDKEFSNVSFIPFTKHVVGLTLDGFYYPLQNYNLNWGSTRCISNKLLLNNGTFSFNAGILLLIKSRDG